MDKDDWQRLLMTMLFAVLLFLAGALFGRVWANHDSIEILKGTYPVGTGKCTVVAGKVVTPKEGMRTVDCTVGVNPIDQSYFLIILESEDGEAMEVIRVNSEKSDDQTTIWKKSGTKTLKYQT